MVDHVIRAIQAQHYCLRRERALEQSQSKTYYQMKEKFDLERVSFHRYNLHDHMQQKSNNVD